MKVLNSADVIGEEIKEDARRKAGVILRNAEKEIDNIQASVEKRLKKLKDEQFEIYKTKLEEYRQNTFVALPIKKWKEKMSYVEGCLNSSLQKYFDSLTTNERLFIIKNILKNFKKVISQKTLVVRYANIEKEKIERLVLATFPDCKIAELKEATYAEKRFANVQEGVILEDVEHTLLCKAGLEQAKLKIFSEIKEELFYALFGSALSE